MSSPSVFSRIKQANIPVRRTDMNDRQRLDNKALLDLYSPLLSGLSTVNESGSTQGGPDSNSTAKRTTTDAPAAL